MTRFLFTTVAAASLFLLAGSAHAQDRCFTELVGKTYTCQVSGVDTPNTIATVTMSFTAELGTDMNTSFAMYYGSIPYACACMPSGKPGKVKGPETSTSFACIKSWPSPLKNEVMIDGKVGGKGKKISKGRWLSNALGTDSYVYTCEVD